MRFYVYLCVHFYQTHLIYSFLLLLSQSPAGFSRAHADIVLGTSEKQGPFSSRWEEQFLWEMVESSSLLYSFNMHYRVLLSTSAWCQGQTVDKKGLKFQGNALRSWVTAGPQACPNSLGQWLRMWLGKSCCLSLDPSTITLGPTAS